MNRPYIVCHMVMTPDGKVTGDFLSTPECEAAAELYYDINRADPATAFACGRVTMEGSFTHGWQPDLAPFEGADVEPGDFVAQAAARRYAVAFDRMGCLGWQAPEIEDADPGYGGSHIVEVLSSAASLAYRAYLRSIGVSYIVADDIPMALCKLRDLFGIERMLLEGGADINGAFLRAGAVDELSLVLAPVIGAAGDKSLFTGAVLTSFVPAGVEHPEGPYPVLRFKRKVD